MIYSELITSLKFGLDKLDSLGLPNFESEELDLLLNQAQDRYVKQRYGLNNNKRQSFEETQKRTDDLKALVINAIITPSSNATDNKPLGRFVTLPSTVHATTPASNIAYWFTVQEECDVTYTNVHGTSVTHRVVVKPISHDEYNNIIKDPFNKPDKNEVVRLMENGKVELIPGTGTTLGDYYLRYIKRPIRIASSSSVTCELSEHCHSEIVEEAIRIALEAIESPRGQTFE